MIFNTKTELRKKYKSIRNSIPDKFRKIKSTKIINNLSYIIENKKYNTFFVYNSFSSEVETGELIKKLEKLNKEILIPKCNTDDLTMKAVKYKSTDRFFKNIYGIEESTADDDFCNLADVIIVPGIAFDVFGNRIGFGKGYYDKFICSLKNKPLIVGLCFEEQITRSEISSDEHDVKMDILVTDERIIEINVG